MAVEETASAKDLFCKTVLCKFFAAGRCKKGKKCMFAHGTANKAPLPDFYKTRLCPTFVDTGLCPHGDRCNYAHSQEELRSGITKANSNAGKRALAQTTSITKLEQKASVPNPQAMTSLQQLLSGYGVPEASENIIRTEPLPEQSDARVREESNVSVSSPMTTWDRMVLEKHDFEAGNKTRLPKGPESDCESAEFALAEDIMLLCLQNLQKLHVTKFVATPGIGQAERTQDDRRNNNQYSLWTWQVNVPMRL
jgi:hypothetical protein